MLDYGRRMAYTMTVTVKRVAKMERNTVSNFINFMHASRLSNFNNAMPDDHSLPGTLRSRCTPNQPYLLPPSAVQGGIPHITARSLPSEPLCSLPPPTP